MGPAPHIPILLAPPPPDPYAWMLRLQIITDDNLLQFGSMIGESTANAVLELRGVPGPVGALGLQSPIQCLYGITDRDEQHAAGWEKIVEEHKPRVHCWGWRKYVRKGLYAYKSSTGRRGCWIG